MVLRVRCVVGYTSFPRVFNVMFGAKPKESAEQKSASGLFGRLKQGLKRTHAFLLTDVDDLFQGKSTIDQELLDTLEDRLLMADFGISVTKSVMDSLPALIKRKSRESQLPAPGLLQHVLQETLLEILRPVDKPLTIADSSVKPFVILMAGVNGVGKTTSIGKLARHFIAQKKSVMLAAGDTFRAAAVEQLQEWGKRNNVPVIAQKSGADSAAVIFDALQSARAHNIDVMIADTAGRLHTQGNLMDELKKIRNVITKFDRSITPECLLVLDAGTGQNALVQARQFNEAIGVTGIMLTKLDGTARGGIIFALAKELCIPVRFVGVGEQADDLQVFNSQDFINALFAD